MASRDDRGDRSGRVDCGSHSGRGKSDDDIDDGEIFINQI